MLRCHVEAIGALKRLHLDKDGVVSFEYVLVAASVVAVVGAAFGTGGAGSINAALASAMGSISTAVATAVGS